MQTPSTVHFFEPNSVSVVIATKHHQQHHHHSHDHHHHEPAYVPFHGVRRSFWNTRCCCHFSAIPDELMICHVFTFLEQRELAVVSSVCKRWQFLATDPFLWRTIDFSRLIRPLQISPPTPATTSPTSPNSDEQFAVNSLVSDTVVTHLVTKFAAHLEGLKLVNSGQVSSHTLSALAPSLHHLQELHLCNLPTVNEPVVAAFAAACPRLQRVSLFGCLNVTDSAVQILCQSASDLKELSLRGCVNLTNASLQVSSPNLEEVNLSGCRKITSEGIVTLAQRCSRLKRVNLHGVSVSDAAVSALAANCPDLESLHISNPNPFGFSSSLSDAALIALARSKRLACLNLEGAGNITDQGLAQYARGNTAIRRLNLGGCIRLTDNGVFHLVTQARQLTHLSLFQSKITDRIVYAMMHALQHLQHLDLHGCSLVTPAVADALNANAIAHMQSRAAIARASLDSDDSDTDSSASTSSIASSASGSLSSTDSQPPSHLTSLAALLQPPPVAVSGFREVPLAFPQLVSLDISGCRNFTSPVATNAMRSVRASRPSVNLIHY